MWSAVVRKIIIIILYESQSRLVRMHIIKYINNIIVIPLGQGFCRRIRTHSGRWGFCLRQHGVFSFHGGGGGVEIIVSTAVKRSSAAFVRRIYGNLTFIQCTSRILLYRVWCDCVSRDEGKTSVFVQARFYRIPFFVDGPKSHAESHRALHRSTPLRSYNNTIW